MILINFIYLQTLLLNINYLHKFISLIIKLFGYFKNKSTKTNKIFKIGIKTSSFLIPISLDIYFLANH